jgi:cellulose synthase/poly-beta-1,6-N-acetylglucosamine synthase-like glycosyltransferase
MSDRPDPVVAEFVARHPFENASRPMSAAQKFSYAFAAAGLALFFLYRMDLFLRVVNFTVCFLYFFIMALRLGTVLMSLVLRCEERVKPEEIAALDEAHLPVYTVLVPLYHEAEVVPELLAALEAFDYPKDKLDVKLL